MPQQTCSGATIECTFGTATSALVVLPANRVLTDTAPAATVMDHIPMSNIMSFGMCQSLANPTVAAATSAAQGVLTPMPCVPNTPSPWVPGVAQVMLGKLPALDNTSQLSCVWLGVITVSNPGQESVELS
jgi:hypothetical protein